MKQLNHYVTKPQAQIQQNNVLFSTLFRIIRSAITLIHKKFCVEHFNCENHHHA